MTKDKDKKVLFISTVTRLDIAPDRVLQSAIGELQSVVIAGYDKEGKEYFASSIADAKVTSWLLDRAKKKLLDSIDDPEEEQGE